LKREGFREREKGEEQTKNQKEKRQRTAKETSIGSHN
jgi:hypothetical protein